MSETMHIEVGSKKLSKSEAIRQAITVLGEDASAIEIQQHAEKACGIEIDKRTVYQIKSNLKTGRDTTTKSSGEAIEAHVPKASKPAKPAAKAVAKTPRKKYEAQPQNHDSISGNFDSLVQLLHLVKKFGGSKNVMSLLESIETAV